MANSLNPAAWNRFGYVYGNPVNLRDPSGHCPACVPLLYIALGALVGEGLYAGYYVGYAGHRANATDLVTWTAGGAVAGAMVYMAPAAVGYGMSAAGMDAIGTAVWLNRLGISATSLYGLMNAGRRSYNWGVVLQHSGWQVVGYGLTRNGFIEYGPLDDLKRPTGAHGLITEEMLDTGTTANPRITPPGFQGAPTFQYNRGHLVAKRLGGSGDVPENLVTLYRYANMPVMRGFEGMVYKAIAGGESVSYEVTPVYSGVGNIPIGVTLSAEGSGGFQLYVTVLNRP